MFSMKQWMAGLCLGLAGLCSANAGAWSYGKVDAATFEQAVAAYRDDPTYLVNNQALLRALTPEQLSQAIERLDMTHYAYLHPVVLKGKEIPELIGQPVGDISVMGVRGGRMQPIPFQIDEMDQKGWVYLPEVSPNKLEGTYGKIDPVDEPVDEVVFMYRDTGYEPYVPAQHGEVKGRILKELAFESTRARRGLSGAGRCAPQPGGLCVVRCQDRHFKQHQLPIPHESGEFPGFSGFPLQCGSASGQTGA